MKNFEVKPVQWVMATSLRKVSKEFSIIYTQRITRSLISLLYRKRNEKFYLSSSTRYLSVPAFEVALSKMDVKFCTM